MVQGYVGAQIRRANRNLLITNIVFAGVVVAILIAMIPYIRECLGGPYDITLDQIANASDPHAAPHRYVKLPIDTDRIDSAGWISITGGDDHKNDYYFLLNARSGRSMVILNHSKELPDVLVGSLKSLSSDFTDKAAPRLGAHASNVFPVMFDTASYTTGLYIALFTLGPLLLLNLWNISKAVRRMGDPLKSPTARALAKVGPPEEMAVAIDAELSEGGNAVGSVKTTRSWLIQPGTYSTSFVYLGDIAWAYKSETKHKTYGVTTNRTYATVINDVHGRRFSYQLSQVQVDTLLRDLAQRVPWAIIGYSADLAKSWTKNRADVLRAVEERKRQMTQAAPEAADAAAAPAMERTKNDPRDALM